MCNSSFWSQFRDLFWVFKLSIAFVFVLCLYTYLKCVVLHNIKDPIKKSWKIFRTYFIKGIQNTFWCFFERNSGIPTVDREENWWRTFYKNFLHSKTMDKEIMLYPYVPDFIPPNLTIFWRKTYYFPIILTSSDGWIGFLFTVFMFWT